MEWKPASFLGESGMPSKSTDLVYWDTCVFFGFLKKEEQRIQFIIPLVRSAEAQKLIIATSTITITESYKLAAEPNRNHLRQIREFLQHEYIRLIALDRAIAFRTQEIRQEYEQIIDFEDSIHLATAIENNIPTFLTYDGYSSRGRAKKLIQLHQKLELKNHEKLQIMSPHDYLKLINPLPLIDNAPASSGE